MPEPVWPSQRMRYSLESRCRIVRLILDGLSPQAAAAACGASRATGYRLWGRYKQGGWAALADRRSTPRRQQPGELLHVDTKRLGRFWRLGHRVVSRGELPGNRGAG